MGAGNRIPGLSPDEPAVRFSLQVLAWIADEPEPKAAHATLYDGAVALLAEVRSQEGIEETAQALRLGLTPGLGPGLLRQLVMSNQQTGAMTMFRCLLVYGIDKELPSWAVFVQRLEEENFRFLDSETN